LEGFLGITTEAGVIKEKAGKLDFKDKFKVILGYIMNLRPPGLHRDTLPQNKTKHQNKTLKKTKWLVRTWSAPLVIRNMRIATTMRCNIRSLGWQ
jgi:hypothetical protein